MIEKIHTMISEFIANKGITPKYLFICREEIRELEEEAQDLLCYEGNPQDGDLKEVCGLIIQETYREISMHITT